MKIGMFAESFFTIDGGSSSLRNLTEGLKENGDEVEIFAPAIKKNHSEDPHIHPIPSFKAWPTFPENIRLPLPVISSQLKQSFNQKYDLIHGHSHGFFPLLGLFIAKKQKIPFVMTFHTFVGYYAHYFLNGKVIKPHHLNKVLLKKWADMCDGVIAPSEKMKSELLLMGVKKEIAVIPNSIDMKMFNKPGKGYIHKLCSAPKGAPILLSAGRLGKEKNHLFTLKVFLELSKIDSKTHLVILGEGSDLPRLKQFLKKNKLENRVHLPGNVPFADMSKVYADADIFLLSSLSENNPMVILEAAASKLPLLVTSDPAYNTIVKNNINGYQLEQDPVIFANKIHQLLSDPKKIKLFGENSYKIAKKNYSKEAVTKKMLDFYTRMIKLKNKQI